MNSTKKIVIGVLLFAIGWTLQHFYVSRIVYAGGMGLEEVVLEVSLEAELSEENRDLWLDLATVNQEIGEKQRLVSEKEGNEERVSPDLFEKIQTLTKKRESLFEKRREARTEVFSSDEAIEERVDSKIAQTAALSQFSNSFQGVLTATAVAILLKIIGMFLAITACISVITTRESAQGLRVGAMVIALFGTYAMLTDRTALTIGELGATGATWFVSSTTQYDPYMKEAPEPAMERESIKELKPDEEKSYR